MNENETRIIEINGVKLEVDLRSAKRVDSFKIGDHVKLLIKEYGDTMKVHPGVIVGFDAFESLPTIVIAYMKTAYNDFDLSMAFLNAKSEGMEIVAATDLRPLQFDKAGILDKFDREIQKKTQEVDDLRSKRDFFLARFGAYFKEEMNEQEISFPSL